MVKDKSPSKNVDLITGENTQAVSLPTFTPNELSLIIDAVKEYVSNTEYLASCPGNYALGKELKVLRSIYGRLQDLSGIAIDARLAIFDVTSGENETE